MYCVNNLLNAAYEANYLLFYADNIIFAYCCPQISAVIENDMDE